MKIKPFLFFSWFTGMLMICCLFGCTKHLATLQNTLPTGTENSPIPLEFRENARAYAYSNYHADTWWEDSTFSFSWVEIVSAFPDSAFYRYNSLDAKAKKICFNTFEPIINTTLWRGYYFDFELFFTTGSKDSIMVFPYSLQDTLFDFN